MTVKVASVKPPMRVPAPLPGRERGRAVAGQVEGVDERHVVERDVSRVVLLVVGEDDRSRWRFGSNHRAMAVWPNVA